MEVCIRRAKPGDEETLAMIQIKSWQSAFADILDGKRWKDAPTSSG